MDQDLFQLYSALKGKGKDELMQTLAAMTAEQTQTGEMSDTKMEEIYRMLSPMLTEQQRKKMLEVIRRLKA